MAVPVRTWRRSALYTVGAETVAGCLAAIADAINAEVAANPLTACWQVADEDTGTLVLKRTTVGGGGAGRIMLFGGSSPHTTAVDGHTANTTGLYIGYAPSAAVDAPEQAYTAGVPFTTGVWLAGGSIILATYTGINRFEYWETPDGIFFVPRKEIMNSASGNLASGFAGELAVSLDGNTAYSIANGSSLLWVISQDVTTTPAGGHWCPLGTEGTGGNPRCNYLEIGEGIRRCRRAFVLAGAPTRGALRTGGSRRYFPCIEMANSEQLRTIIKLRQIANGVDEVHAQTMSDVDGVQAHKIGSRSDAIDGGPWLTNFAV